MIVGDGLYIMGEFIPEFGSYICNAVWNLTRFGFLIVMSFFLLLLVLIWRFAFHPVKLELREI